MKLTDQSLFPIGKAHRGTAMEKVPAEHLLWWWDDCGMWNAEQFFKNRSAMHRESYEAVRNYIIENFSVLELECKDRIIDHRP